MRTRTIGILLIVLVVLLPTWFTAIQTVEHAEEVGIDAEQTDMRPLQSIVDTPEAMTPAQVGVVIWLALGGLLAVLVGFHRFMDHLVRPPGGPRAVTDGGALDWFQTEHRWVAEYVDAAESDEGVFAILALSALTVVLAVLLIVEFLTLARTQYVGLYVGGIFLALAGMTAAYYAWFLPHVHVAEERYHD
ncbi:MAG: hypothetical protein ACOCPT_05125 [Halanaeroarchaeum sp.]